MSAIMIERKIAQNILIELNGDLNSGINSGLDVMKLDLNEEVRREGRDESPREAPNSVQAKHGAVPDNESSERLRVEALQDVALEGKAVVEGLTGGCAEGDAQNREAALTRLLEVLEAGTSEYIQVHTENALENSVELSQQARLRAAHAAYALATNTKMRRVGYGAWLREQYV